MQVLDRLSRLNRYSPSPAWMKTSPSSSPREFPNTSRTLIQRIQSSVHEDSHEALNEFFSRYWLPLYGYLRLSGEDRVNAEDLVQGFVAKELLERGQLAKWNPEEGSLRGFLKTCIERYRHKEYRKETAQKRGGKKWETHIPIDFDWAEMFLETPFANSDSPDEHFDRQWAAAVVNHATFHLAQRYRAKGKEREFQLFIVNLQDRGDSQSAVTYEAIARELDSTVGAVKQRMRQFRTHFEQSLRATVGDQIEPNSVQNEVVYLLSLLEK